MPSAELNAVIEKLKEQEANVSEILSELEEQVDDYKADLKRIQDAISALQSKPKSTRKKSVKQKPSASKEDVSAVIHEIESQSGGEAANLSQEELRKLAESRLLEKGFSRSGLGLRFKQFFAQTTSVSG